MLFGSPETSQDLEEYEKFIKAATKVPQEGRRAGAKDFYIAGDFTIDLRLLQGVT